MDVLEAMPRPSRLGVSLVHLICGVAAAAAYVLIVGLLSVQAIGVRAGVVLDLNNEMMSIKDAATPWTQAIGIAILSAAAVFGARRWSARSMASGGWIAIFGAAVVLAVVAALGLPARTATDLTGELVRPVTQGWRGWLEAAGASPAVHVVLVLLVVELVRAGRRMRRTYS